MTILTVFSGVFCQEQAVVQDVVASTGYTVYDDAAIVTRAHERSGIPIEKVHKAFGTKTSVFNKFTHEKELSIAHLKLAMADVMASNHQVITGLSGMLIPRTVGHVLRVCLIADLPYRLEQAATEGLSSKQAQKIILREDGEKAVWVQSLFGGNDPWDETLYDMVLPLNRLSVPQVGALIEENLLKTVLKPSPASRAAVDDFHLSAAVEVALLETGHAVGVSAEAGKVTLTINKHVLMRHRLEEELRSITDRLPGVTSVDVALGPGFHQSQIYRKHNFEVPAKVLLVDDEREFVQTLSERLEMREMGSAVAFDGNSALELVREEDPEVMIIDLKMPGIDGLEVLKQVKQSRPEIEVIVLTGHGSEKDRQRCMSLGAFAYLQKPVDIDALSDTLKQAYAKVRQGRRPNDRGHDR